MQTLQQLDFRNKTVFLRTEFNVVLDEYNRVVDDSRIRASLPTISYLRNAGARLVVCAHLGRPWGKRDPSKSLQHLIEPLSALIGDNVIFATDCIGNERMLKQHSLHPGEVLLLENVRYYNEENVNDEKFALSLAEGIDVYINDAFGNSHRSHASMVGVPKHVIEKGIGLLLQHEVETINSFLSGTVHPSLAIVGGAKVAGADGKIHAIRNLISRMDSIAIVGKIAYYFLEATGAGTGATLSADKRQIDAPDSNMSTAIQECAGVLSDAQKLGKIILLPLDSIVLNLETNEMKVIDHLVESVPRNSVAMDIGPRTIDAIKSAAKNAKAIVWNGPAGFFEDDRFKAGTLEVASAIAQSGAKTLVGGGETVTALQNVDLSASNIHVCTGGGAMLSMLMGRPLPAITALLDKTDAKSV